MFRHALSTCLPDAVHVLYMRCTCAVHVYCSLFLHCPNMCADPSFCPVMLAPLRVSPVFGTRGRQGCVCRKQPLPPPPSFSCAQQEESGDDDARKRVEGITGAVDWSEFECDPSAARRKPHAPLGGKAHAPFGGARQEEGRVAGASANIIRHLEMQGGGTAAGVAAGAKSKTSSNSGDGGGKKLTTDGDLKQLLAARQRRLRDAEEVDAGLYFHH